MTSKTTTDQPRQCRTMGCTKPAACREPGSISLIPALCRDCVHIPAMLYRQRKQFVIVDRPFGDDHDRFLDERAAAEVAE